MRIFLVISVLLIGNLLFAQSSHKLLRTGDKNYLQEDFASAEIAYHKSLDKSSSHKSAFNLGNALYKQEKYEEASKYFAQAAESMPTDKEKSKAFYNLGNALIHNSKLEESIAAYKKGLKLNPQDAELRENLLIAKLMKQQAQEQQQDQNQEQSTSQQEEQQDSLQQQQAQETELDSTQLDSTQRMQALILSKEEAERLLQAAELEEKKVQEKMRMVKNKRNKPDKDSVH